VGGGFYLGPPYHYYGGGLSLILVIVILVLLFREGLELTSFDNVPSESFPKVTTFQKGPSQARGATNLTKSETGPEETTPKRKEHDSGWGRTLMMMLLLRPPAAPRFSYGVLAKATMQPHIL